MGFGLSSISNAIFGKSGYTRQEQLDKQQLGARNREIAALSPAVRNAGAALSGYTANAYNPYDAAQGAQQFNEARDWMAQDANKAASALSGSNAGRFSRGYQASLGDIRDKYERANLKSREDQLAAETNANQMGYGNQMSAIQNALQGNAQMLGNTGQLKDTQSMGLLSGLQAGNQILKMGKSLIGGGTT